MLAFFVEAIRLVNLPYTVLLGLILAYWVTVALGMFDVELFDFDVDGLEFEGSDLLGLLNLGDVPFSIWLTVFSLQMWVYSLIFNLLIDHFWPGALPDALRFVIGAVPGMPIAALVTGCATKPLRHIFDVPTVTRADFVGQECLVTSSVVNEAFGIGEVRIDGIPHILDIRAKPEEQMQKGDKAIVFQYDVERDLFYVTRL